MKKSDVNIMKNSFKGFEWWTLFAVIMVILITMLVFLFFSKIGEFFSG